MADPAHTLHEAAERIRTVNHTSRGHDAYRAPSGVYDTYGALAILLEHLPQTISQAAGWLTDETSRGRVRIVSGAVTDDPQEAAAAAEHHSRQAADAVLDAARELHAAHNLAAAMAAARPST